MDQRPRHDDGVEAFVQKLVRRLSAQNPADIADGAGDFGANPPGRLQKIEFPEDSGLRRDRFQERELHRIVAIQLLGIALVLVLPGLATWLAMRAAG